jgi:hypothetical protein
MLAANVLSSDKYPLFIYAISKTLRNLFQRQTESFRDSKYRRVSDGASDYSLPVRALQATTIPNAIHCGVEPDGAAWAAVGSRR